MRRNTVSQPVQCRLGDLRWLISGLVVCAAVACRAQEHKSIATSSNYTVATPIAIQADTHAGDRRVRSDHKQVVSERQTGGSSFLDGGRPLVRVALFGDQGLGARSQAVLDLVRDAGVDFVVILGDFDYVDKPRAWGEQLNKLGDVPWFAVIGNHDVAQWPQYQRLIAERQRRIAGARCTGDPGFRQYCAYRDVSLIFSGIGTLGAPAENETFIQSALGEDNGNWKLCLWHKNQHDMQLGRKTDEVGWGAYKACQSAGAIVVTGHEHSYARTRTLTAVGNAAHGHGATGSLNEMIVGPGKNFVVVSGLGGVETRPFVLSHATDTWWSAYFTANRQYVNGTTSEEDLEKDGVGAFFIDFGVDNDRKRGRGRFVTALDRRVFDDFSIRFE